MLLLKIKNVPKKLQRGRESLAGQMSHSVWMDLRGKTSPTVGTVLIQPISLAGLLGWTDLFGGASLWDGPAILDKLFFWVRPSYWDGPA